MKLGLSSLQPLGRALMLPIAVLPIAGLLLRIGQHDLLDLPFMAAAGGAVFSNLGLLFAIGVAVGFAKDQNGAAGLAGVVCFLIAIEAGKALLTPPPEVTGVLAGDELAAAVKTFRDGALTRFTVPIGILSGLIGGTFYNWFSGIKLPEYLAFFGGRRFVPIVSGVAGVALGGALALSFNWLSHGMDVLTTGIVASGEFGLFGYGLMNRLLIITGLHHILNNVPWFILGEYQGKTGDIARFLAGDPTAGRFMAGFFPVMMFGLPAACLAMYHAAAPDRRKAVGGMLFSLALTAFLTGVTEPIEFTFMFLAPVLYAIHAVLTGVAMVVMSLLDVRLGFSFSAGLFDYVLNYGLAERPLLLIPVGLVYAGLYYVLFRFFIARFNLKTPGREDEPVEVAGAAPVAAGDRGAAYLAALGGSANVRSIDACTTRLRLVIGARDAVDEPALKRLGARGVISPTPTDFQVVVGPIADALADEVRTAWRAAPAGTVAPAPKTATVAAGASVAAPASTTGLTAEGLLDALGGRANLRAASLHGGRLLVTTVDPARVDADRLLALGARGVAVTGPDTLQVVLAPGDVAAGADLTAGL